MAREEFSSDEIFRLCRSSSDDQSSRQHRMNGGLWKQWQERRGTTIFGEKNWFQILLRVFLRITMPKD